MLKAATPRKTCQDTTLMPNSKRVADALNRLPISGFHAGHMRVLLNERLSKAPGSDNSGGRSFTSILGRPPQAV
jgi:hypothetical protein